MIGQLTPVELIGYSPSVLIGALRSAFDAGSTRLFTACRNCRKKSCLKNSCYRLRKTTVQHNNNNDNNSLVSSTQQTSTSTSTVHKLSALGYIALAQSTSCGIFHI